MAHHNFSRSFSSLLRSTKPLSVADPLSASQCLAPRLTRPFASQTDLPVAQLAEELRHGLQITPAVNRSHQVLTTLYNWPQIEPTRYVGYNPALLNMPLRRDLLHRAVIYEGDNTRQGTAHTKYRTEVHGSNRKILPQKGTGNARAGDKKSPIRKGGGVAFGPRNTRNFKSDLPRKVYDKAFRTALSLRHRRGELIVIDGSIMSPRGTGGRFLANVLTSNSWGKGFGRSFLVTETKRERLMDAMATVGEHGIIKELADVDVKDLLEKGRLVIEKEALDSLLVAHMSDLGRILSLGYARMHDKDDLVHATDLLGLSASNAKVGGSRVNAIDAELEDEEEELSDEAVAELDGLQQQMMADIVPEMSEKGFRIDDKGSA